MNGSFVRAKGTAHHSRVYPLFATMIAGTAVSSTSVHQLSLADIVPHLFLAGHQEDVRHLRVGRASHQRNIRRVLLLHADEVVPRIHMMHFAGDTR